MGRSLTIPLTGALTMPSYTVKDTAGLFMKTSAAGLTSGNLAAFWTAIDLSHTPQGWESNKLAATAVTTEQTIIDITDKGVLTHVVAPELSGSGTMTIRVTADGVVSTFVSETIGTGARFCIGLFLGFQPTGTASDGNGIGGPGDRGFEATNDRATIITPLQALAQGNIGIAFKTTLKVTIQGSVNITATAEKLNGCANHSLFIPEGL